MDRSCVGTDSELKDSAALVSCDKENDFNDGSLLSLQKDVFCSFLSD